MNKYKENQISIPLIPLRGIYIFPNMVIHFDVGREISLNALDKAMMNDNLILLATQKDIMVEEPKFTDIYSMGTVSKIKQTLKLPNGATRVLIEGLNRLL